MWGRNPLISAIPLWMLLGNAAAALHEPEICYVLDAILFLYGIILTALYCRLKINHAKEAQDAAEGQKKSKAEESIYTGLTPHAQDTYETIGQKKGLE